MASRKTRRKPVGLPLADLLYLRRRQMRLTQEALAQRLRRESEKNGSWSGATPQLIHRYELGATPRLDSLTWLAASLKLSLETVKEQAWQQRAQLESINVATSFPIDYQQPSPALVDSTAGGSEVERREFAKVGFVGALGILPGVDMERLRSVLAGTRVDSQSLDQLAMVTDGFMRQSWSVNPQSILPAVIGHFNGFRNVLLGAPSEFAPRAHSITGEVAFLAGYLSFKRGLQTEADFFWQTSERMAQSAGNTSLQSILFTIRGWQARDEGQPEQALTSSDQAQSLLGGSPNPRVAALTYSCRAYDLAAAGRSQAAIRNIESAEHYLEQLPGNDTGAYVLESIRDELDLARGWHLFHLRQYSDAAQNFQQILARLDPTWKAQQSAILAHLGSVYAQQGNVEQAAHTFSNALRTAREAAAPRYEQRTATMRQQWLGNNDSAPVRRLDEEFLTLTPSRR
ncbi:MAG: hypothetical protein ACREN8_10895 [Candidatus Dormibacteraceae bacterium]